MRIVVFGATGVLGRQVVPRLVERGRITREIGWTPAYPTYRSGLT